MILQIVQTTCPKCQINTSPLILSEYDFYYELYHNVPTCGHEWTYSSYEQCKALQEMQYEKLKTEVIHDFNNSERTFTKTFVGANIFLFGLAIMSAGTALIIGGVVGSLVSNSLYKDSLKTANLESYILDKIFTKENFPNHQISSKYLNEAKPYLDKYYTNHQNPNHPKLPSNQ